MTAALLFTIARNWEKPKCLLHLLLLSVTNLRRQLKEEEFILAQDLRQECIQAEGTRTALSSGGQCVGLNTFQKIREQRDSWNTPLDFHFFRFY